MVHSGFMGAVHRRGGTRVELEVDDASRRFHVLVSGPATGPEVAGPVTALFRRRPKLTGFDMRYDIRGCTGDVTADDIDPIVEACAAARPHPARPTRTAFLTFDPHFHGWAEAMGHQFLARTHHCFSALAHAEHFLRRAAA